jgi:hypothetical protein
VSAAETTETVELVEALPSAAPVLGDLATVPADSEMRTMFQLANVFAASQLVPKPLRNKPNDCLLVMMTARDLGLSMTVAFRECHVVDGRVTTSPKLKLAIVRARGLGKVWPDPGNNGRQATWHAIRCDAPDVTYTSTFTLEQAKAAGLTGKDNWKSYPQRMLSWRALGYLLDDAFGEVGTGLYDADELGAVTDENGRPIIDVTEVPVPEGMAAPRGRQLAPIPASSDQLHELRERIKALPEQARVVLAERWAQPRSPEAGGGPLLPVDAEGRPITGALDDRSIRTAFNLVAAIEREVERGKHADPVEDDVEPAGDSEGVDDAAHT